MLITTMHNFHISTHKGIEINSIVFNKMILNSADYRLASIWIVATILSKPIHSKSLWCDSWKQNPDRIAVYQSLIFLFRILQFLNDLKCRKSVRNLCKSTLNALESLVDNIGVDHPFNNITQLMEDILGIG